MSRAPGPAHTHGPRLTQRQDAQPGDDLPAGRHAGQQPLQAAVLAHQRHHGVGQLGVAGHVQRRAAVKDGQGLAGGGDTGQRSAPQSHPSPWQRRSTYLGGTGSLGHLEKRSGRPGYFWAGSS